MRELSPPTIYDNTIRTSFKGCNRKFLWWWLGYDYQVRPSYFTFGSAWGMIKENWYSNKTVRDMEPYSPEWWQEAAISLTVGLDFWAEEGGVDDAKGNNRSNLTNLWKLYLKEYPVEPFTMIGDSGEVGWTYPLGKLGSDEIYLAGAFDGYVEWPGYGVLVAEEKTVGVWLGDNIIRGYSFSSQITQYDWYLKKLVPGDEAFGVLVNMVCKQIPAKIKNWLEAGAAGPVPASSGKTPQFARTLQQRSDEDLAEFERDWWRDIEDVYRSFETNHWPKTVDTILCTGGIGKSPCLYQGLCLCGLSIEDTNPLAFPNIVRREDEWTPWLRGQAAADKAKGESYEKDEQVKKETAESGSEKGRSTQLEQRSNRWYDSYDSLY